MRVEGRGGRGARIVAGIVSGGAVWLAAVAAQAAGTGVPFDSPRWRIEVGPGGEHRVETWHGRTSLYVKGGGAVLDDVEFLDGTFEFDIAFGPERGFSGGFWRFVGDGEYEEFYLRPHQTGRPDSFQYTPVFHGNAGWQLYHGAGYGGAVEFPFDEWIHVRVVVSGGQAEAYVDSDQPVLFMHELKRAPVAGKVGVYASSFAPARFSNFSYEPGTPTLRGRPATPPSAPAGSVLAWDVSSAFDGSRLDGRFSVASADTAELGWTRLAAEATGIATLARLQGTSKGADTVFARAWIDSDAARTLQLDFGYSDRVRVFLNGRALYSGDNTYQSRDFRYLGTIGLFDSVPLELRAGSNELLLAVTEAFGGWGVVARLPETEGVSLRP